MLNTPLDKKIQDNPLRVSPYFDNFNNSAAPSPPEEGALLQENGFYLLQENGDKILLG